MAVARHADADVSEMTLAQALYRLIHRHPEWLPEDLADEARVSVAEVESTLDRLERLGLLVASAAVPGGYAAVDPEAALLRLFTAQDRQMAQQHQQLARTQDAMRAIMADFLRVRADEREAIQIESLRTPAQVNAFLDDAVSMIRDSESTMHPGGIPPVELMDDMLLRDQEVVDRGIRLRTLYARHVAEVGYMNDYLHELAALGVEVRLAAHLPMRMLIFDDDRALLPIDPADSSQGAFAIHGLELVRSLDTFFDFCWHDAIPLDRVAAEDKAVDTPLSPQEELIVRMLAAGAKDEAIARQLGISARTLSRALSNLLENLGVQTRFQAALKVAELGILQKA